MAISEKPPRFPFVYGAQYYRAPTPEPEYWDRDFVHMKQLGFNTVKFWVQWRWSERTPGRYFWDDLDQLMQLAERYELKVILNLICDVMPVWAERRFPDCRMVDRRGIPVNTEATVCRQLGGYPGPCYNHPGMLEARKDFFRAALEHFNSCSALLAWDVWNEPEHHLNRRGTDSDDNLLCYCPHCLNRFREAMAKKYDSINQLNQRWGRCYNSFEEVEASRSPGTVADFIDWREFQLDTLTGEAKWRLNMVREIAPGKFPHLHVVPHTIHCFNAVNCVDDFALAEHCDVFGFSMTSNPAFAISASSSAGNRPLYNAEWHINFGSTALHPRVIDRKTFLREAIPQLAWGVRGYLYWQFRPEALGFEAPAWGLIRGNGSEKPVTSHAAEFIRQLTPYLPELMRSHRRKAPVAILKSRRNELFFHTFPQNRGNRLYRSIRGWENVLLKSGVAFRFISSEQLEQNDLAAIKVLILPAAYYMSQKEADAADRFLRNGGTLIAEGSVAGYCHDTGRHSIDLPGCGLAERWGIHEIESVSTFHMECCSPENSADTGATGDTEKALCGVGSAGGEYLPLDTPWGRGYGALNCSFLTADHAELLASVGGAECVLKKNIGRGTLIYAGTYLGIAAAEQSDSFPTALLRQQFTACGIPFRKDENEPILTTLYEGENARFFIAENPTSSPVEAVLPCRCRSIFDDATGRQFCMEAHSCMLFVTEI